MKKTLGGGLFRLPKKYLFLVILILFLFISSFSYAYWKYSDTQDLVNVVGTKCLQLTMHNETDGITITDAAPTSDEKGKTQEGYTFTIKNTCNTIAYYQVNLEEELENNIKRLSNEYIKVSLNESEGKLLSKYEEVDTTIKEEDFTSDESHKLTSDRLNPNEEKEYTLKLWMADSTPAIEEVMDATFESKVSIIAISKEEEELENTITISYTEPEYYSKEIEEVTITATSETYNLIEYSLDKEIWNSFAKEGKEETITQSYTIENIYPIYFKDEAGNIKEQDIVTNKLDQTGPEISIEETNDDEGAVVNITFNDPKSGLYEYKIKDEVSTVDIEEEWTLLEEANTQTIQYHSNVNKPIHITVKDKLENEIKKDYDITKADIQGPEIKFGIKNEVKGENDWYKQLTITSTITDDRNNIKEMKYCTTTGETCDPKNVIEVKNQKTENFEIKLGNNKSPQKLCIIASDTLNNSSGIQCSSLYKVDGEIPVITSVTATATEDSIKVTANTPKDSFSGIPSNVNATYTFVLSNKTTITSKTNTATFTNVPRSTTYTITVTVKDNAGNVSKGVVSNKVTLTTFGGITVPLVTSGNGLYLVTHNKLSGTTDNTTFARNEYRYAGKNPNNYVSFDSEKWKIIGLVNTVNGQRIKIIRTTASEREWNTTAKNDFASSSIKTWLNGSFYNSIGTTYQNMIDTITWSTGGSSTHNFTADVHYVNERSTIVYSGNANIWKGNIGLVYTSDYGYATSGGTTKNRATCLSSKLGTWNGDYDNTDCYTNNWIYNLMPNEHSLWTMNHNSSNSTEVLHIDHVCGNGRCGHIGKDVVTQSTHNFYPVLYLKTTVKITGGSGTSSSPYTLSL